MIMLGRHGDGTGYGFCTGSVAAADARST